MRRHYWYGLAAATAFMLILCALLFRQRLDVTEEYCNVDDFPFGTSFDDVTRDLRAKKCDFDIFTSDERPILWDGTKDLFALAKVNRGEVSNVIRVSKPGSHPVLPSSGHFFCFSEKTGN